MQKVSIFIPVYRESELLEELLDGLIKDPYRKKEIFVVIDKPTKKSLKVVEKFKKKVKFILNGKRKGKVNALNEAVKYSSGDIFLFLDSDVKLPNNKSNFLKTLVEEMKNADIVEIKKKIIQDSFLSRIVNYDYLSFNFVNWLFSKFIKKCIGINGAAFAIRREVFKELGSFEREISEDLDIAIKSFLKNKKFSYLKNIEVLNKTHSSWKKWFEQRKRWSIGLALWIKKYFRDLIIIVKEYPQVILPAIIFLFPTLLPLFLSFLFSTTIFEKISAIFFFFILMKLSFLIPFLSFSSITLMLIRNLFLFLTSFFITSILFFGISRKMNYRFNLLEFAFYFFIYCPFWFFILLVNFGRVFIFNKRDVKNWKV